MPNNPLLVSIHGGHSGDFCSHAQDSLEAIVKEYIARGFAWVGITEHLTPIEDRFIYSEERKAGLDVPALQARFRKYMETCARMQKRFRDQIEIFIGIETETYSGSETFIQQVVAEFAPDYIVGSLHHTADMGIDTSEKTYFQAAELCGGLDNFYCRYFDEQHKMIQALKPAVVGHFDLVRYFDPEYKNRLQTTGIQERVRRNLDLIKSLDLILELNLAGFDKTAGEPYPTREILVAAIEKGIAIVPGDDSHGLKTIGRHFAEGVALLAELGCDLNWRRPAGDHQQRQ